MSKEEKQLDYLLTSIKLNIRYCEDEIQFHRDWARVFINDPGPRDVHDLAADQFSFLVRLLQEIVENVSTIE